MKILILFFLLITSAFAGDLERDFVARPDATKPRCYWYWIDGKVSKDGITKDLEAMKRVGIGEASIGVIGGGELKALTDEWWGFLEHAIREGTRLGVDIGVFNSPGWSQSGGPWVKPNQAMRYVTLPEMRIRGPQHFEGKLPTPTGEFQDIAVLAFPAPAGEEDLAKITSRTPTRVSFEMPEPFTARSLTLVPIKPVRVIAELEVSDDGERFRSVKKFLVERFNLEVNVGPVPLAPIVVGFPETKGKFFRLNFSSDSELGDIRLSPAARVERFAEKSLQKMCQDFVVPFDHYVWPAQAKPELADLTIKPESVLNLSSQMSADGTLRWDVPAGDWIILRTAMTPTGTKNQPAPPEATGLEVDKMSRTALKSHFDAYIGNLCKRMPEADRKSWKHVVADSYETGSQNWTDDFKDDFQKRYGYDPVRFLPVMTGRIVGSADQSDRFLWDMRRMVADRIARDYVGGLSDLCHEKGLKMWLENYGHWGFPAEFLQYAGNCDEVAGEFWVGGVPGRVEVRDASSAAHIYGKRVVWAEAFTGGPAFVNMPRDLKALGDWAFSQGINQFMLHVYIHQPWDDKRPGMNAWFGTEFNRHNTWFEYARPWVDYLRRCSVMLQAGNHVADVAYFIGEDAPKMDGIRKPELPPGYDYDYINADVIMNRLTVKDGRFVLPDGMSYRLLVLPESKSMRPELLKKIQELVAAGGAVLGPAPEFSPSLANFPASDAEVKKLASELWNGGRVMTGTDMSEALQKLDTPPDVQAPKDILWTHRRDGDTDIYFLSNQSAAERTETISFRVGDRAPEFWRPESGLIEKPAVYDTAGGRVTLPVQLGPVGSVFVVFRQKAEADRIVEVKHNDEPLLSTADPVTGSAPDGTFTLALWVNPAEDTTLRPEANRWFSGMEGGKNNFVEYPTHGDTIVPGGKYAGVGLAVGRNGVSVIEHGASYFPPVLTYAVPLTGWTHLAVVYRNGQPRLYVNGVFVHEGLKSERIPQPSISAAGEQFKGSLGAILKLPRALSDEEIARLAKTSPTQSGPPRVSLTRNARGGIDARVDQPGAYEMKFANGKTGKFEVASVPAPIEIPGPWEVSFDPKSGGPGKVTFDKLEDWILRPEPGIKFYSGKATYRTTFNLPPSELANKRAALVLDLGKPAGIAIVRVNGKPLGELWLAPWRIDMSAVVKPGVNTLEVDIVNNWNNRLAGDAALPAEQRIGWVYAPIVKVDTPLQSSGLLGPVKIVHEILP